MSLRPYVPRPATSTGLQAQWQHFLFWLRQVGTARVPLPPTDNTKDISQHPFFLGAVSRGLWRFWFVRITRAGRWFFFFTFALTLLGVTSLEVQTYIVLLYSTALWAVASLVSWFVQPRVVLRAGHVPRSSVGEVIPVRVDITNPTTHLMLDLSLLPSRLPVTVEADPVEGVSIGTLEAGETHQVVLGLRATRRGVYILRGWRVETDFPFGLINAYREYLHESTLIVHPLFMPLSQMETIREQHAATGALLATRRGDSLEYLGSREFREGDAVRDIDWRATARMGGMPIVREWREEQDKCAALVLDNFLAEGGKIETQNRLEAFERAVSLAASVGDYLVGQEYEIAFLAVGDEVFDFSASQLSSNGTRAIRESLLDALASVEASADAPLPGNLSEWDTLTEAVTEIVCFFLQWDAPRQGFVDAMRQQGLQVKPVLVLAASITRSFPADVTVIDETRWSDGISVL